MSTPSKPAPDKAPTKWTIQFGLPASEILVDDFGCSLWHKFHLPGRMFVFQYHMCFLHKMPPMNEMVLVIPLTTVMTVEKAKSMKVLNNAIEVEHSGKSADGSEDGPTKLFFSNFMKRDTAWEILKRTWDLVTDLSQIKNATEAAEERHRISLSAAPAEVEQIMSSQMSPPSTPPQTKSPTSPARSSPHAAPPLQLPPVAVPCSLRVSRLFSFITTVTQTISARLHIRTVQKSEGKLYDSQQFFLFHCFSVYFLFILARPLTFSCRATDLTQLFCPTSTTWHDSHTVHLLFLNSVLLRFSP